MPCGGKMIMNLTKAIFLNVSLLLLFTFLLTGCNNQSVDQIINERIDDLVTRNQSSHDRLYDLTFEIISTTEVTMIKHFVIELDDAIMIGMLNERHHANVETETDVARFFWNESRQDYRHEARIFHFHTGVNEFTLNVRYLNTGGEELRAGSFTHPHEFDEEEILEDLAISFPDEEFIVTATDLSFYRITCVTTGVTFNTIGSGFSTLTQLYLEELWRDFREDWRIEITEMVEEILQPVYQDELNLNFRSSAFIYGEVNRDRLETRHFEVLNTMRINGTDFEISVETFTQNRSELPFQHEVRLSIGYMVHVESMNFENEADRIRVVTEALKNLTSEIPIDLRITFIQENSYMVYIFSLPLRDVMEEDLATYDFAQHFVENSIWHCPEDMDRGVMCPPEIEAYFENR